jgi:hypothetical protein|tara:strand:+ start:534 stop:758 length:225 start_codon:yes stop_codon:yes gene_type:complete
MTMETVHIKEVSSETLLDYLANAKVTTSCLGHSKGENNEALVRKYTRELESRGVEIPDDKYLFKYGEFNGRGSY